MMSVKKIIVGQLGARMYYGVPKILHRNNMLLNFYTDYVSNKFPLSVLLRFLSFKTRQKLESRNAPFPKPAILFKEAKSQGRICFL